MTEDTIAAIATPAGYGGIGVIRISGPLCSEIAFSVLGFIPEPRFAHFGLFKDLQGNALDQGIALFFPGPHSFTGEDVLELQGHGGPVVLNNLLASLLQRGARIARPGEFSERAFLNGKIDLVQAEAIADLIESASTEAAKAALCSLQGVFSQKVQGVLENLIVLRTFVEAALDFPEEDVNFLDNSHVEGALSVLSEQLMGVLEAAQQGALLREGMTIVIVGRPNAGKSSLINQLTAKSTAIVADIPGTTRDVLREWIHVDGLPLHIVDTAGLHMSDDVVEQEGVRRALQEIEKADQILWVVDHSQHLNEPLQSIWPLIAGSLPDPKRLTLLRNKIDLIGEVPQINEEDGYCSIKLCAKTGEGVELLKQHFKKLMGFNVSMEGKFSARSRHLEALKKAYDCLQVGCQQFKMHRAGELLAEDLRLVQQALDQITGRFSSDDLLGRIFSSFCIGK